MLPICRDTRQPQQNLHWCEVECRRQLSPEQSRLTDQRCIPIEANNNLAILQDATVVAWEPTSRWSSSCCQIYDRTKILQIVCVHTWFLKEPGVTCPVFVDDGCRPASNDRLALIVDNALLKNFIIEVGNTSSGDVFIYRCRFYQLQYIGIRH